MNPATFHSSERLAEIRKRVARNPPLTKGRRGGVILEAIIPAAGYGKRLKSKTLKPLVKISGKPLLVHTLLALARLESIQRIIIAVHPGSLNKFKRVLKQYKIKKEIFLVLGGKTRQDSVNNCLKHTGKDTDFILVHDAVRPFISRELIAKTIQAARDNQAAAAAVPSKSTLKRVTDNYEISETLDRRNIWEIQTPQVFKKDILINAYRKYGALETTDDASLVEKTGIKVKVVLGSYFNIKITTPEDLVFARAILKESSNR